MKFFTGCIIVILFQSCTKDVNYVPAPDNKTEYDVKPLIDTLTQLSNRTRDHFFRLHCLSMIQVIKSKTTYSITDVSLLDSLYSVFCKNNYSSPRDPITYKFRERPYIISWISPTDSTVSFSWLNPPIDWDPAKEYPMYVELHGFWSVASNSIEYLSYPFITAPSDASSFEDGYLLSPWGRGNLNYEGISETDIWESIKALKQMVKINPQRQYLSGHSMGGYGAWCIAGKSPDNWAALGIHAGALVYHSSGMVNSTIAKSLKNLPTYFVCGSEDDFYDINVTAYQLLIDAGNKNTKFVTFEGGHEYIENNVENMYLWMRNFININTVDKK